MDLKQLEYFVAVVDLGSFTRASRMTGVAQPAISRQVRSLEVELRQNLLLRNGRGATPTEAGKRLLVHARSILQQVERARREVDDAKGAPVGQVVLGLPPTLARAHTAQIVRDFRRLYPKASISIVEGLSVHILEWVAVGRVDVGVPYNPAPSPAIELTPLIEEPLCLISRKAGRRTAATVRLRDLPAYPLVIPSRPHSIRALVETRLAAIGARPQVALEVDAVGAILELVAEGQGHAILSRRAASAADVAHKLVARPIVRPALTSSLAIAVSAQRPATPVQDAAVTLVTGLVTASAAGKGRPSRSAG
ncbi:MAG TPA: LysR family transcriptional regulator [Casimicrobiaceae bacterium]|nr:LysR family transcriptional regulator [Casimicrobiaceae bacterium]